MSIDLSKLQDGQVVEFRLGKAGDSDVKWRPWQTGPLHVQRRTAKAPSGYRGPAANVGDITCLTPKGVNWAEYLQNDYNPTYDTFTAEDYYMQIKVPT